MAHTTSHRITLHAHTKGVRGYHGHGLLTLSGTARRHQTSIDEIQAIAGHIAFDAHKEREAWNDGVYRGSGNE